MPERDRSSRGRPTIRMSPFLLTAILAALVSTAVMLAFWTLDASSSLEPMDDGTWPPSPYRSSLIVAVGVASAAWLALIIAACYEQIVRHLDQLGDRLEAAAARLREEAEEDGVFRGMAIERSGRAGAGPAASPPTSPRDEWPPEDEPAGDDEPPTNPSGRVLPFPG